MKKKIIMLCSFLFVCSSVLMLLSFYSMGLVVQFYWAGQYDVQKFNCKNMTYALAPVFHRLGFNTVIIHGWNENYTSGHCWVSVNGVYWDAVSLWFNDEKKFTKHTYVDEYPFAVLLPNGGFLDEYQGDE